MSRATRWTIGIAALAAAVTVSLLVPPEDPGDDRWLEMRLAMPPEAREALRARQDRRRERVELERAWRSAVVRDRAAAVRTPLPSGLALTLDPRLGVATRASIDSATRAEIRALGVTTPRHPIAVVAFADSGDYIYGGYERSVVIPTAPDRPCTIVMRFRLRAGFLVIPVTDRVLGTCAFYAAYGAPGTGMRRWLIETNLARAGYLTPPAAQPDEAEPAKLAILASDTRSRAEYLACVAGREAGCEAVFTPGPDDFVPGGGASALFGLGTVRDLLPTPEIRTYSPAALSSERAPITSGMLGALATAVGDDRFAAIWRSDLAPAEEYQRVQGEPLAAWVERRVRSMLEPYRAGPGLPLAPSLLAWALILGSAVLAITRTRRMMS